MQRQLDDAVFKLPGERFAFELIRLHSSDSKHAFEGKMPSRQPRDAGAKFMTPA